MKCEPRKPTTVSVIGHSMDSATLGDSDRQSWFASLVLPGYAFINPHPRKLVVCGTQDGGITSREVL
ncbi:hypothetical protein Y032_0621g748 [Ancylostoma ceylanicum]|uniref:Uncharacterized protein n=1 Tax=Ancylostoma ceylanicum TaxID=53326 RepID=A0A016WKA8_9BILA|nr:hypothetical protein Y032_0621g748 [Ancylostoma ceylanicum]